MLACKLHHQRLMMQLHRRKSRFSRIALTCITMWTCMAMHRQCTLMHMIQMLELDMHHQCCLMPLPNTS
eukprot:7852233-Karenia_brevis.AAC.1